MPIKQHRWLFSVSFSPWYVSSASFFLSAADQGSKAKSKLPQQSRREQNMAFLELEGIAKYFGRTTAVDHISLSIKQGEFLTLLGPSGCGKTTILRMVAGFETPDEGSILLDGEDITNRA